MQLATPNAGVSGNSGGIAAVVDRGPRVQVSIVQNNPLRRDALKQLRDDSAMVAAGIWR